MAVRVQVAKSTFAAHFAKYPRRPKVTLRPRPGVGGGQPREPERARRRVAVVPAPCRTPPETQPRRNLAEAGADAVPLYEIAHCCANAPVVDRKAIQHQRIDLCPPGIHVADAVEPRRVGMGQVEQEAGLTERRERRPAKVAQRRFVRPHDAAPLQNAARGIDETVLVVAVARATNVSGEAIQLSLIGLEAPSVSTGDRPPVVLIRLPDGITAPVEMRLEHRELMLEEAVAPNVWTQPVDERLYGRIAQVFAAIHRSQPSLDAPPDHSTISRTRRLIDLETHQAVFTWILARLADGGLVKGKTVGIDATTLEANAALRSIVRRDTGDTYQEFLITLAQASGIKTPTRAELARIDRKRKKKGSNDDWTHPHDPDATITKMKDGRTHLAHKAEHAVDLETGALVAVTVQDADEGDPTTSHDTLIQAAEHIEAVVPGGDGLAEVVGDKGYHSNQALVDLEAVGVRSYISEPDRGRRHWKANPEARDAVYRNRRRIRGARGKRLLRQRGERLERPFAHLYETGRMRRVHLRGHDNIFKRALLHAGALNLGLLMRQLVGIGTPRSLQGRAVPLLHWLWSLIRLPETRCVAIWTRYRPSTSLGGLLAPSDDRRRNVSTATVLTTGC